MAAPLDPRARQARPPLVGREREQATLRDLLAAALAGHGGLVLIGGEAGIGKTTLAEWTLAEAAARGALVLVGRCYDLAETPPYGPWREVFARVPRDAALPVLPTAVLPIAQGGENLASQEAIFARVGDVLAALAAHRSLVLLLEDLHWADQASLDLLRVVGRDLHAVPILLLVTYRRDELTRRHPLSVLLPTLVREARGERIDLHPLAVDALRALIRVRYGLPDADEGRLIGYIGERAEGNPFYAGELLRMLEDVRVLLPHGEHWALAPLVAAGVPPLLRQVIDARAARLGEVTHRLLAIAAVIGQAVPLDLWADVAEVREEALLDPIERAGEAGLLLLADDGAAVRFAHALIRETLYAGVLALRRRRIHRRAGEALAALPVADPDAVADHFRRAGDVRAAEWLEWAGARAQRTYAWVTAAARYEAALALLETGGGEAGRRGWLALRLAALRRYADPRRGVADAEAALRLAGEAGDPLLAGAAEVVAGLLLGGYLVGTGRGIPRLEAGLTSLGALPAAARVPPGATAPIDPAQRWGTVVQHLAFSGRYAEALARGERYLAEVAPPTADDWLDGDPYADALVGLGHAYLALGRPAPARAAFARNAARNRAGGHPRLVLFATWFELTVVRHYQADQPAERRRLLAAAEEALGRARALGADTPLPGGALPSLMLEGRWAEARRIGDAHHEERGRGILNLTSAHVGALDREQGLVERARALLADAVPGGPATAPDGHNHHFILLVQRLGAALALDAGDLPGAHGWLAAHDTWLAWAGAVLGQSEGRLLWSAYHRQAGDPALARRHAEAALARASAPRQPLALLAARRLLGELATDAGDHAEAQAHLDATLALAEACAAPYERALTLLAQAELRAATADEAGARLLLAAVCAICAPLGAALALARAEALTARLDGAPVVPAPAPAGLTVREVEVLRLLAGGASNRAIAGALFLSPHTVERHVANVYAKTDVHSRAEATAFARRHRLV